ncbi:hypothetical protein GW17_00019746 [Ensete ventricosum]|nr:hypothetical protein GW17_00019746 [Ensete ventricosum]
MYCFCILSFFLSPSSLSPSSISELWRVVAAYLIKMDSTMPSISTSGTRISTLLAPICFQNGVFCHHLPQLDSSQASPRSSSTSSDQKSRSKPELSSRGFRKGLFDGAEAERSWGRPPTVVGCGGDHPPGGARNDRSALDLDAATGNDVEDGLVISGDKEDSGRGGRGCSLRRFSGNLADAGDGERVDHRRKVGRGREWPRWSDGRTLVSSLPHPGVV